jgi:surfactin synthase thioesterase subunit
MTIPFSLVCLPFAGGGASFYRPWKKLDVAGVRVAPLQLPGREESFSEDPFTGVLDAARYLAAAVVKLADRQGPVALFGHSLGAVLAYETARALEGDDRVDLLHLFVSGSPAPGSGRSRRASGLDDDEFLARVEEFAGYRHHALDDPSMRELLLPLLRVDVAMHEDYEPVSTRPLDVPVTSLRGADDTLVLPDDAARWAATTSAPFRAVEIPGGHMYLADSPRQLLELTVRSVRSVRSVPLVRSTPSVRSVASGRG